MAKMTKGEECFYDTNSVPILPEYNQNDSSHVCQYCSKQLNSADIAAHNETCDKVEVPCPNECKKGMITRSDLENHKSCECPKQDVACPFVAFGCNHRCLRQHMSKHINASPMMHLAMACDTVVFNTNELKRLTDLLTAHKLQIKDLRRRSDSLEKLYGSQCVWKIQWFQDKQDAAKYGSQTTIFSPPFLTSRQGYKLALSLCPVGDGKSRGQFMSVFICICKGEYDALLQWPFRHHVTFTLIDQCPAPQSRRNTTFTIKPKASNENNALLRRPTGPRNPCFGAQQFVELDLLDTMDYVRDDVMFIKCSVDCQDMLLL